MFVCKKSIELKRVLIDDVPNVLINLISAYFYEPCDQIDEDTLSIPVSNIFIIDDMLYYYPEITNKCVVLSLKYNIVSYGVGCVYGIYYYNRGWSVYIDNKHISQFFRNPNDIIIKFKIYGDELYFSTRKDYKSEWNITSVNVFCINLRTKECKFVTSMPHGDLLISLSYVYTVSYNETNIYAYHKIHKTHKIIKPNLDIVSYITDHHIYGTMYSSDLYIQEINSPNVHNICSYDKIYFGTTMFYVINKRPKIIKNVKHVTSLVRTFEMNI
jgi:hypothetical protein